MDGVVIMFKNGEKMSFQAREFNIDLSIHSLGRGEVYDSVHRFEYRNSDGTPTPLYLNPSTVASISIGSVEYAF